MKRLTRRVTQCWAVVGQTARMMLHVWTEPSLAATHQFQPDLTRAELAPIIEGTA